MAWTEAAVRTRCGIRGGAEVIAAATAVDDAQATYLRSQDAFVFLS